MYWDNNIATTKPEAQTFDSAYGSIRTGDIVFINGAKGLFSWLITTVTRSSFSHVGIACWLCDFASGSPMLFIVEAAPSGRRVVSMSHYGRRRPMTVVASPVEWTAYRSELLENTGNEPYGYLDLIGIALKELFGLRTKDFDGEVCSEMVADVLNANGFKIEDPPSPGKLYQFLMEQGCRVTAITTPN